MGGRRRIYVDVADELRTQIKDEEIAPHGPMPSIGDIQLSTGYARQTVAQAFRLLETEGLIERRPGLGYYLP